jgi:hypothetical protein
MAKGNKQKIRSKKATHGSGYFWTILSLAGMVLFFILLRWNSINIPLVRDEGEYAYSGWLLGQNIMSYAHAFMQKPPMIIYTYWVASLLDPAAYWPFRLLAYIFAASATGLLGFVAYKEFGRWVGLAAMWIVIPMILLPGIQQFTANTEQFMLLPLMGVLTFYILRKGKGNAWHWFLAGVCAALTILYKPTALPILSFLFIVWTVETWLNNKDIKEVVNKVLFGISGAILASLLIVGYFLAHDGGRSLFECVVNFNRYYNQFSLDAFVGYFGNFWKHWWILFLLAAWFVISRPLRWWFYAGLMVVAVLSTYCSKYEHYYIVIMPFWALISAVAINDVAEKFAEKPEWLKFVLILVVVGVVSWPDKDFIFLSPEEFQTLKYQENSFSESPIVAKRVAELTSPGDYVYVAGSEPQILYGSKRLSSTRFVIAYPLMINTPLASRYQEEIVADLTKRPPAVIVMTNSPLSWLRDKNSPNIFFPYLNELLRSNYDLVGGFVREGRGGRWQEPLENTQLPLCSLSLFKKRLQ